MTPRRLSYSEHNWDVVDRLAKRITNVNNSVRLQSLRDGRRAFPMNRLNNVLLIISFLAVRSLLQTANAHSNEIIIGNMRIQALSQNLIRIEQRGPKGFEDRNTFTIVSRKWPGETINIQRQGHEIILTTTKCRIELPNDCQSLEGIVVQLRIGKYQYRFKGMPPPDFLPGPVSDEQLWILRDYPRLVPPAWVQLHRLKDSKIIPPPAGTRRTMQRMFISSYLNERSTIGFDQTSSSSLDQHRCRHSLLLVVGQSVPSLY